MYTWSEQSVFLQMALDTKTKAHSYVWHFLTWLQEIAQQDSLMSD